jgi:hypothetical protein
VPEPIAVEGDVERLVVIEGDSGADGWAHQHSEAGLRSAARLLRTLHDGSVGWEPPPGAVFCAPEWNLERRPCGCRGDVGLWNSAMEEPAMLATAEPTIEVEATTATLGRSGVRVSRLGPVT